MNLNHGEELHYQVKSLPVRNGKIIIISLAVTLSIFLVLPLADLIFRREREKPCFWEIAAIDLIQPPIEQPLPRRERPIEKKVPRLEVTLPKPEMTVLRQLAPEHITADLIFGLGEMKDIGSFALSLDIGDAVLELFEIDSPPHPILQIPPLYPMIARSRGIEGEVELVFIVRTDGRVDNIQVISSYPGDVFTRAAVNAVSRWRFRPGIKDGREVNVRVFLPIKFELK